MIEKIEVVAVLSDGSTLQTLRRWPDWPEQARPQENVAVPAVDGRPRFAGMTAPVTVRSGPAVVADTFRGAHHDRCARATSPRSSPTARGSARETVAS
ncbi:hypothetical protein [Allokutzneria albata]|uniref:Uncharacterized protein n=1 Tax=Allokutzneria albata TaxID=211114 RepID=A0A1G9SEK2_ALLAB|nr:hypothetical protein [Allokutzneria albata]SDM33926.1 hypothetical protein SAMN04489726_1118 [Allokutzneria albata]